MSHEALCGQTLGGRYRLDEILHEGLDLVFAATDTHLERAVVVKVIRQLDGASRDTRRAFDREVRRLARLYGDHSCQVLDYELDDEAASYLVMERLEGERLDRLLEREGPLSPHRALQIVDPVAEALLEAHAEVLLHRDVKTRNVMVRQEGGAEPLVKLFDHELALEGERAQARTRQLRGDPQHMAPEESSGEGDRISAATDVYLWTLMLYELLAGAPPFVGDSPKKILLKQLRERPPPLPGPAEAPLRAALDTLLGEGLRKDPEARPPLADYLKRLEELIYSAGDAAYRPLSAPASTPEAVTPPPAVEAPRAGLLGRLLARLRSWFSSS